MAIKKLGSESQAGEEQSSPDILKRFNFSQVEIVKAIRISMAAAVLIAVGIAAFTGKRPDSEAPAAPISEIATSQLEELPTLPKAEPAKATPVIATTKIAPPRPLLDPEHPSFIAKEIILALIRNTEQDEEWGTRIAKVEIAPLINDLYLARKKGFKPNLATYKTNAYPPDDMELLNELQQSIQKRPDLNLLVEGMLRQYGLMHCETLDAALRSWLIPS